MPIGFAGRCRRVSAFEPGSLGGGPVRAILTSGSPDRTDDEKYISAACRLHTSKHGETLPRETFEDEFGPSRPLSDFMSPERFAKFNAETTSLKREMEREMSTVRGSKRS